MIKWLHLPPKLLTRQSFFKVASMTKCCIWSIFITLFACLSTFLKYFSIKTGCLGKKCVLRKLLIPKSKKIWSLVKGDNYVPIVTSYFIQSHCVGHQSIGYYILYILVYRLSHYIEVIKKYLQKITPTPPPPFFLHNFISCAVRVKLIF